MAFLDKSWWNSFLFKLEKRLAARAKIIGQGRATLAALTRDSNWNTYDATSITSAKARWIILNILWAGTTTQVHQLQFRKKGHTTTDAYCYYREVGSGNKEMSWQIILEMNESQEFEYNTPASGTLNIYCTGYIETGRQW